MGWDGLSWVVVFHFALRISSEWNPISTSAFIIYLLIYPFIYSLFSPGGTHWKAAVLGGVRFSWFAWPMQVFCADPLIVLSVCSASDKLNISSKSCPPLVLCKWPAFPLATGRGEIERWDPFPDGASKVPKVLQSARVWLSSFSFTLQHSLRARMGAGCRLLSAFTQGNRKWEAVWRLQQWQSTHHRETVSEKERAREAWSPQCLLRR